MSSVLGDLAGTAERYTGQALAFGLGFALANVLTPLGTELRQDAWGKDGAQILALKPEEVAEIVAQALEQSTWGESEAQLSGVNADRLALLTDAARSAPGVGELLTLLRRSAISDDLFEHGLRKHKLEDAWHAAIGELVTLRLEPAEIAKAIHRGIIAGHGLLVVEPPATPGLVPIVPPSELDPVAEAAAAGIDAERLRVLVGNAGLPPGIVQMLQLSNRGIITKDDFLRGVGESNMRNEWGEVAWELRRRLLTPHDYVEARVRAWIDDDAMHAGAALSGMTEEDTDLLFKIMGRPLSPRQVFIGLRRGGTYSGPTDEIDPAFLKALEESNVRPEWYNLAWAGRESYPSAFVLRSMAQAGELTEAETEQILLYEGWSADLAKLAAQRWSGGSGGGTKQATQAELETEYEAGYLTEAQYRTAISSLGYAAAAQNTLVALGDARRAKKYREQAVTAIAKAYTTFAIGDDTALGELETVHITGDAAANLLSLWKLDRLATIKNLNATQIQKAHAGGIVTTADATTQLENLRYTPAEAAELLGP